MDSKPHTQATWSVGYTTGKEVRISGVIYTRDELAQVIQILKTFEDFLANDTANQDPDREASDAD